MSQEIVLESIRRNGPERFRRSVERLIQACWVGNSSRPSGRGKRRSAWACLPSVFDPRIYRFKRGIVSALSMKYFLISDLRTRLRRPPSAPTLPGVGILRERGQSGTVGVDKTGNILWRGQGERDGRVNRVVRWSLRFDNRQVHEDGRPLARAAGRKAAGKRCARPVQGDGRPLARRRLQELAQAAAHGMRIYVRLRDEEGYRISRSTVQRYVRFRQTTQLVPRLGMAKREGWS